MALTGFLHDGVCWLSYDIAMSVKFGSDSVLATTGNQGDKIHFYQYLNGTQWVWSEYLTTGGAWTLQYHSPVPLISFVSCDPALPVAGIVQAFDPVLAAAFWSFAMTFIFGCWLLAKNAGVILSAIKRF